MTAHAGPIVLFGSGETSPRGGQVWEAIAQRLASPLPIAVLETPAGFELNSAQVAARVADFVQVRLQNYRAEVTVVPARKRGTSFSPDDAAITAPILEANLVFLGPGSPTYAVRQLHGSLAWQRIVARHRLGSALVLASAAAIAAGAFVLPVYEIFKVGEDPHWRPGLDLLRPYGLALAIIPHWNNAEGGAGLDTSRCFVGQERFAQLLLRLPATTTVLGIEEQTALVIDVEAGQCDVLGLGGVHLIRSGEETHYASDTSFRLDALGRLKMPEPGAGILPHVWSEALRYTQPLRPQPPIAVSALLAERERARAAQDWATADALRRRIGELGWSVVDTAEGSQVQPDGD
jgi:cyanophycinase-like exopeptidase